MFKKLKASVPVRFATEAKEAEWWDRHPEAATQIMKRAIRSGKVRGAVPLKTVTIRLPVPDLETVRDLAEREGLSYQHCASEERIL
jgi:hypothetical protein